MTGHTLDRNGKAHIWGWCDMCQRRSCPQCDNCDCDGYPCEHQKAREDKKMTEAQMSKELARVTENCAILRQAVTVLGVATHILMRHAGTFDDCKESCKYLQDLIASTV